MIAAFLIASIFCFSVGMVMFSYTRYTDSAGFRLSLFFMLLAIWFMSIASVLGRYL